MQSGFFDLDNRHIKLDERDPLKHLNAIIDWEIFRSPLEAVREKPRKSNAGRKPMDVILMFKILILQHLYNLSDDQLEFQIRDRYTFCRFLGLSPEGRVPDAKTIWVFREQLVQMELIKDLFIMFDCELDDLGYKASKGQIVDASFVDAPKQRNSREENAQIKEGEIPKRFESNENIKRQKDVDARWTKKNDERHYGYKNHIVIDSGHKLIRDYEVTAANVHDSQVFIDLLCGNTSKDVWADSAYSSEELEFLLKVLDYRSHVCTKGSRNKPLSEAQIRANYKRSKKRVRVEHVFGSINNEQGGLFVRVIGQARAAAKVGLTNLAYNMRRLSTLSRVNGVIV